MSGLVRARCALVFAVGLATGAHGQTLARSFDDSFDARAAQSDTDPAPFRDAYLAHLAGRAADDDGLSRQVLGRSAKHVLLLHANAPDAMFRANGRTLAASGATGD